MPTWQRRNDEHHKRRHDQYSRSGVRDHGAYKGTLKITVSCLIIGSDKVAKVKWSETEERTTRTIGSTYSFDAGTGALDVASSQLVLAEASYEYTPIVGMVITGNITLSDRMFMSPRITAPDYDDGTDHKCAS